MVSSKENMTPTSDEIIINQINAGDSKQFAILVDRYKDLVFTLALRMMKHREEAEEVSQDTFIKVYKSLSNFKGDSKLSTWIYRIAYHACLDRLKKNKRHYLDVSMDGDRPIQVEVMENAFNQLVEQEQKQKIQFCLEQLTSEDAFLITLYYFEDLSMDEISKIVSLESNHVKVKLFRIRKKLASILKSQLEPEIIESYGRARK